MGAPFFSLEEGAQRIFGERRAKQAMLKLERIIPPKEMQILRGLNRINRDYCEWWRELIQETRRREVREKKSAAGQEDPSQTEV